MALDILHALLHVLQAVAQDVECLLKALGKTITVNKTRCNVFMPQSKYSGGKGRRIKSLRSSSFTCEFEATPRYMRHCLKKKTNKKQVPTGLA